MKPHDLPPPDVSAHMSPLLSLSHVTVSSRGGPLIHDVSLDVWSGEIVGLFGPSGAGKTSIFRAITGQLQLSGGLIEFGAADIRDLPLPVIARLGLGYVSQGPSLIRSMSVEKNLLVALETLYGTGEFRANRLDELLTTFNLERVRKSRADSLSGGERRRCEIARTLASEPKLLMLDEPFAAIDPIGVAELCKLLRGALQQGIGILLTDHNLHQSLPLVDRAYILDRGQIIAAGTPAQIVADPAVRERYLGESFQL